jgi:lipopolysaccharide/colanic/teichoic acid biosynthesis glycosyltransferase
MNPSYKRPFDLTVLILSHLLLAPIFILLWTVIPLMIWLEDRGPVFYRQRRPGQDDNVFTVLKFRSMVQDAERRGPAWTVEADPRVTRVGRLLRKTALDELPQLLSIWKGDLSFVGPRAIPVEEQRALEEEIPGFAERLRIRPGLTGPAQVYNAEDEPYAKLQYDLDYMSQMNPIFDFKLMLLSVRNTLFARWDKRGGKKAGAKP